MNLTPAHRNALGRLWSAFDDREITYVVLRGYEDLPESIPGSDVDVLVASDSFDGAVAYCKQAFEPTESVPRNALALASMVVESPHAVFRDVTRAPADALAIARDRLVASEVTGRGYVERTFDASGLQLHLVNHLAYESPMDGSKIRVDPAVEDAMFERRIDTGEFYTPAPPDRLAHLVCRGVFDYGGTFPDRYATRCDALVETIRSNPRAREQFRDLLSRLFYAADALVYEHVVEGTYDVIRPALRRFSDY